MLGLALEGGGAKGSYQIGAWKAFRELGIEFDGVVGTSIGAINGALIVSDAYEKALELWEEVDPRRVIKVNEKLYDSLREGNYKIEDWQIIVNQLQQIIKDVGIDITPMIHTLEDLIDEDLVRKSNKDYGFVTVCLTDKKSIEIFIEDVPRGKLVEYIVASSYLPIFKNEKFEGKTFLDGGFYNNLPINMLIEKGYKEIIAIKLLSAGRVKKLEKNDVKIIYIKPNQKLGKVLDFSKEQADYNFNLGYFDTMKVFKKLKGEEYYIKSYLTEEKAIDFFNSLSPELIMKLKNIMLIKTNYNYKRTLFENIIPKLIELLRLDKNASYENLLIRLLEALANYTKLKVFNIYTIEEMIEEINNKDIRQDLDDESRKFFDSSDLFLRFSKDEMLKKVLFIILENKINVEVM